MKQTQLSYPTLAVSFQTTTGSLPLAQARIHTLRDGELVLYKRSHSRVWQCRYKLYDNQWRPSSTSSAARCTSQRPNARRFEGGTAMNDLSVFPADIAEMSVGQLASARNGATF